jgi:hypothetical protein
LQMKTETLANIIKADLLAGKPEREIVPTCFARRRGYIYRGPNGDDSGRFCSDRCRNAYDAGWPVFDPEIHEPDRRRADWVPLAESRVVAGPPSLKPGRVYDPLAGSCQLSRGIKRRGTHGWIIECFGCGRDFDSKGLRCCSAMCERAYRKREENKAIVSEVGMELPSKRKCAECGGDIPNWRKAKAGRNKGKAVKVSSKTRFCSDRCSANARKVA